MGMTIYKEFGTDPVLHNCDYCKPEWESARKQLWRQYNRSKINSFKKKFGVNFQFNNQDRRKIKISAYNTSICKRTSKY